MKTIIITDFDDELNVKLTTLKERNLSLRTALENANSSNFALKKELSRAQNSIAILQTQLRHERERNKERRTISEAEKALLESVKNGETVVINLKTGECEKWSEGRDDC
ncbi:hypothetical protein [Campylobacter sp. 19-13652]|uniref:hypothetical protein n=1 Tax=Campylobacter sp. 19-13652 TaxID=2840180 RepID=UPI001C7732C6|nr:hypothetical protein [Campylobacter sp. 19-13652]BCX79237.1 hypothetical protein LBC_06990 [Campylobacter sp. 19-13652]